MAKQKVSTLLPFVGLLAACSDGPSEPPPPLPGPLAGFIDPSPVILIAGEAGKDIPAQVTNGASCTVAASPATLAVELPSGCSPVRVSAPLGVEGTFTVTLTAQLNGKQAKAEQTVTAERRRVPDSAVRDTSVYLNREVGLAITTNADVDACTASLLGASTSTYTGGWVIAEEVVARQGKCRFAYRPGNTVLRDGETTRGIEVRSLSNQPGTVVDVDTIWITRLVPRLTANNTVTGRLCVGRLDNVIQVTNPDSVFLANNLRDHRGTVLSMTLPDQVQPPSGRGPVRALAPDKIEITVGVPELRPEQGFTHLLLLLSNNANGTTNEDWEWWTWVPLDYSC